MYRPQKCLEVVFSLLDTDHWSMDVFSPFTIISRALSLGVEALENRCWEGVALLSSGHTKLSHKPSSRDQIKLTAICEPSSARWRTLSLKNIFLPENSFPGRNHFWCCRAWKILQSLQPLRAMQIVALTEKLFSATHCKPVPALENRMESKDSQRL